MLLTTGKLFMEEVFANGFVTLFVDKNNPDTLTMCSPCGQVQIFKAFDHGLLFPTEIQTLLFRSPDIKKLALFKTDIDTFIVANRVPRIDLVKVHPIIKKNLVEIGSGVLNFLKTDLGETCEFEEADLNKDKHVRTHAIHARALTYGIWLVASRLATKVGLDKTSNIAGYMRWAIFSKLPDRFTDLIADPYFVPLESNHLSAQHLADVEAAFAKYKPIYDKTMKRHRPRFLQPFAPLLTEVVKNCTSCGLFVKSGTKHNCAIKNPECKYPLCRDQTKHTPITCIHIRAWCTMCQRRGHLAERHLDLNLPPPYMWACYLHYQKLHLDTSYMLQNRKYLNPFFHMFTLYGLPTSKLLKACLETGIGADNPTDRRFCRSTSTSSTPPPRSIPEPGKGKSLQRNPRFTVNRTSVLTQYARQKATSSSTSTSTFDGPIITPVITPFALKQAIQRATRISQGEESGTSGTTFSSDPILSALLNMVQHLQGTGTVRIISTEPIASPSVATVEMAPSVVIPTVEEQVDNLSQNVAESVLIDDVNYADPPDYVDTDDEELMRVHGQGIFSEEQVNEMLAGSEDDNAMDLLDPTGTAAIGQGSTTYYNDQNVMDNPIDAADLPQAIPAAIVIAPGILPIAGNLPIADPQQDSETSAQNPTN